MPSPLRNADTDVCCTHSATKAHIGKKDSVDMTAAELARTKVPIGVLAASSYRVLPIELGMLRSIRRVAMTIQSQN